jgi:hypothetical protein
MLHNEDPLSRKVRERAYLLADTGLHDSWRSIDNSLISEGWPNSRAVLRSEYVRRAIDRRCAMARRGATAH